ncbi:MAG: GDP-mannose dehydrogenase, partial [Chloroflexi bacterium]|nr:GDP-mannose dehydrogenase [Chloroflexota bacterium]
YLNSSKKIDVNFLKIVQDARKINEFMPQHVIDLLADVFSETDNSLENSTIAILGISYKPNVHDVQIAPSETIIKLLKEKNVNLKIFDPYFISETVFGYKTENTISDAINNSDATIIVTGHKEFEELNLQIFSDSMKKPIIIDCTGKINPTDAKSKGIIFKGIGRG